MRIHELHLCGEVLDTIASFSQWVRDVSEKQRLNEAFVMWCVLHMFGRRKYDVKSDLFAATWDADIRKQYCPATKRAIPSLDSYVFIKCTDIAQTPAAFRELD